MKARWGRRHWNYPDEDYRVKKFRVGDNIKVKQKSPIPRQYWGARGTVVFINCALTQQIKVVLQGLWTSWGVPVKKPSAWFSEEDLTKGLTQACEEYH